MKNWHAICQIANEEMWTGEIPRITLSVHNSFLALQEAQPKFWEKPECIEDFLSTHPIYAQTLAGVDARSLAHAIRAVRYATEAR